MGIEVSEHHLTGCAFHKHDAGEKRKMLGGVSFDGGAGSAAKGSLHTKAGVQTVQPPFSDWHKMENGYGVKTGFGNGSFAVGRESDEPGRKAADKNLKDTVSIVSVQDTHGKENIIKDSAGNIENAAVYRDAAAMLADVPKEAMHNVPDVMENPQIKENRRFSLDYKKYIGKLRNGIQAFLKGMEQRAGKERRQQPKKKQPAGTRAVTK